MAVEELGELFEGFYREITVGIHAEEGQEQHDGGLTNAEVGTFHEFGLGVPQRSFIRAYFDENEALIVAKLEQAAQRVLDGADDKLEAQRFAVWLESQVKEFILNRNVEPELSDATKKRRGENAVPLVDSSQMLGSIRGKVDGQ